MKKIVKRYRYFIAAIAAMLIFTLINRELGLKALSISGHQIKEMLFIIPPIFVMLGLLDV